MSFIINNMPNLENLNGIKVVREELLAETPLDTSLTEISQNSKMERVSNGRITRKDRRKSVNVNTRRKSSLKEDSYDCNRSQKATALRVNSPANYSEKQPLNVSLGSNSAVLSQKRVNN